MLLRLLPLYDHTLVHISNVFFCNLYSKITFLVLVEALDAFNCVGFRTKSPVTCGREKLNSFFCQFCFQRHLFLFLGHTILGKKTIQQRRNENFIVKKQKKSTLSCARTRRKRQEISNL